MIVLCTNLWNHHMGPVCREMARLNGVDFKMVLSEPLDMLERIEGGRSDWKASASGGEPKTEPAAKAAPCVAYEGLLPPREPWIVQPPRTEADWQTGVYNDLIWTADVAIIGATSRYAWRTIRKRVRTGKLTFFMNERFFKIPRGWKYWLNPRRHASWFRTHLLLSPPNVHYLTMNHWCADDLAFFRGCTGRTWRWGYLVAVSAEPTPKPVREKVRIGWCGRFLRWKNVADILQACSSLENSLKRQIEVILVGEGPEKENLVRQARELGLAEIVRFLPFMSSADAKAFMRDLDVYVFPSGRQEGWGAALGEAMDASCAVIANEAAGATLELVKDGENGFTFKDGDIRTLTRRLDALIADAALRRKFGLAAWQTMQQWSPAVGAQRLTALIDAVRSGHTPRTPSDGLCGLIR